ncbi:Inner membrane transport protein YajR [Zhongshania aliphaticivorans]|uniref:Inner membrane transport protein YajR n=2 Tax=Zhongshania aliphaticivorans TaxID=1470434 RepID=A0A5S9QJ58_9GAMM|nr:Inner membrane transport protein YajR [Zhongshania aliphaticivorans]CAA0118858.1 Inner membrane transport protein YajR [Zhongshania aliphaticivorans]
MSAAERRSVASLATLYAFRMLGLFMLLPVLSLYASEYDHSTPVLVGLALGIYGLGQAALQVPLGMLSDRIGRKPVIIAGLILFAAGGVVAASADNIVTVIIGRLLQGTGAIASTLTALLADLTREQHRTKAMATIGLSIGVSFAVAMVLGPLVASEVGVSGLFLSTSILAVIGVFITLWLVPTPSTASVNGDSQSLRGLLVRCLQDRNLMRLNIGIFSLHAMLMAIFVIVPSLLEEQGLVANDHWKMYLPVMVLAFIAMVPLIIYAEKYNGMKTTFLSAIAALVLTLFASAWLAQEFWYLILMIALFFTAFNLLEASLPSLVSKTVCPGGKGTAMGVYSTFQFFGAFCGGAIGGGLLGRWGVSVLFVGAAVLGGIWLIVAWGMAVPPKSENMILRWNFGDWDAVNLRDEMLSLPGAVDITILESERLAYFRAGPDFNPATLPDGIQLSS